MRRLYLITHPQATHHVERRVGGWYDSALTPLGVEDARRIAHSLSQRVVDGKTVAIFASDLRRTRQTADVIASSLGVEPLFDADLRERSCGEAEGALVGEIPFVPPPAVGDRLRHDDGVPGSETKLAVATRLYRAVDRVVARGTPESIVVTHGGAATFVITRWIEMPIEAAGHAHFVLSPGSITVLEEDDFLHDRRVVVLNDMRHLA